MIRRIAAHGRGIAGLCLVFTGCAINGDVRLREAEMFRDFARHAREAETRGRRFVRIDKNGVDVPVSRFLLIRKGRDVCALRFVQFHTGYNDNGPPAEYGGKEHEYARYELYHATNGESVVFSASRAEMRKLHNNPWTGHGSWESTGPSTVLCGPHRFQWTYPTSVGFHKRWWDREPDREAEFAPTAWTAISEVNVGDRRLKWYRFDASRTTQEIPIEGFW